MADARITRLRWGILGPGRIAPRLVRGIGRTERSALTAVASRDIDRARAFAATHGIATAFGSYDDLLASTEVDCVYISLPNHLHAPWTIRALEAGKHVLCEKPSALTVAEVDAVADAAARSGRVAAEAFMYLHHPQTIRAVELARGGALGDLQLVAGTFSFLLTYPGDPRAEPTMGGGSLWDVGCYPISLARRIASAEPEAVHGYARYDERGVDRTFVGQLRFPGGLLAQFDSGFAAADRERVEIVGTDGRLELAAPFLPSPDGPPASVTLWRGLERSTIEVPQVDQYAEEVADLERVVLEGATPRVDLAFSRGTIGALVELDRSARSRVKEEDR